MLVSFDDLRRDVKSDHKPKPTAYRVKEITITPGAITFPAIALFGSEDASIQPDYSFGNEELFENGGDLRAMGTSSTRLATPRF